KKGPKGSRAKVISQLRETQKQAEQASQSYASPPSSPKNPRTPGLLSHDTTNQCIEFFFAHMYPTMPVLDRKQVDQRWADVDRSFEAYCLLSALSAFMMIQPGINQEPYRSGNRSPSPSTNPALGVLFMEEAVRVRKRIDYVENPTVAAVITSFFLFGCCFGLNKHNTAWLHLRDATALAQLLGMQEESTYASGDPMENELKRRLFWLLFVTESNLGRAYALQKHRPLTLHATIVLPIHDLEPSNPIAGFCHLVNLYRPFDDVFVGLWNKTRSDCSTFWLSQMQQQLNEALPGYLDTRESQAADLRTSQQWLRTIVWQLCIANGHLSSSSPDASMTFTYPIQIAKDLVAVTSQFSQQSMEIHGIGLIEKVFDVTCTLIDVMSCVPIDATNFEIGPLDYLTQLIRLISTLRSGESRYMPLVIAKIQETLPGIASSIIQTLDLKMPPHPDGRQLAVDAEKRLSSTSSSASSAYSTPPFMHYFPMA
ncbi:MAG: hypothetical protein Q9191_008295, partial [Dirinaria sp. TL-2023a]